MLSIFCIYSRLKLLLGITGITFLCLTKMGLAQTGETVAYCNSSLYAVNVYQDSPSNSPETSLKIRVFWREKSLIFADLPAQRSHFISQGFTYTSKSKLSEDYRASLWTLFVPDTEGQPCLLFRNGTAFDSGNVTQRQLK